MQKYIWTEKYSVGVAEIDKQHQHFFEIANDILVMDKKYETFMHEKGIK